MGTERVEDGVFEIFSPFYSVQDLRSLESSEIELDYPPQLPQNTTPPKKKNPGPNSHPQNIGCHNKTNRLHFSDHWMYIQ